MVTSLDNDDAMRVGAEYGMDGMRQFWNMHKSTQNIPEVKKKQQMNEKNGCAPVFQQTEIYRQNIPKVTQKRGDRDPHTNHKKNHQTTNNGQERQSTPMDYEL